ncbi:DUF262 domain-containing protein [Winogradskyella sp.]|jgi:hypothetical protein|uniref:DUF262 domain-containing protein n=1 Tax=Winogradskyella sp. TaxID=1883156 RepID=UPI0025F898E6|nr:DUF262 domain-containing protein [Winogradskyella sp.]MCT4629059.1 DUF262 domain-containing protein [Winogradskyella sp.]
MKRQASVQDITWFLDLNNVSKLNLNPPYQRRSVWTPSDRKFFLDTIFRNYPCPPIFIHKTIDDSGSTTYHVVDGKQRLETIIKFANNKIAMSKEFGDERLDGKRFKNLDPDLKKIFWNYNLAVDFIEIPEGLDINEVFDRVNRNSRNLERQELRHARHNGWFINEAEKEADDDKFWQNIKVTTLAKAKRMKNVQLVSELLLILIDGKIHGFSQNFLDDSYALYEEIELEGGETIVDEEEYLDKKNKVKSILQEMENHNECVSTYAKVAYNLYVLFAFIGLEDTGKTPVELAQSYKNFMEEIELFKKSDDAEELFNNPDQKSENWENAFKYYKNTRGANTDLYQRNERYEALKDVLSK